MGKKTPFKITTLKHEGNKTTHLRFLSRQNIDDISEEKGTSLVSSLRITPRDQSRLPCSPVDRKETRDRMIEIESLKLNR